MASVEERVKKIIIEQLGVKDEEVTSTASYVDDLGVEIQDDEAEKITTVQQAVDYVKEHMKD